MTCAPETAIRTYHEHLFQALQCRTLISGGSWKFSPTPPNTTASCASSGSERKDSRTGNGVGSTGGSGICHSYAPDGRCISLLKILLTNYCKFDCLYCVNRVSSNVTRARFTVGEVVQLTLDFYKRNYIEGLFLSSGIIRSPDYTMEQVVEVARQLRQTHDFRGYIHLKTIPEAAPELLDAAGAMPTVFPSTSNCRPVPASNCWRLKRIRLASSARWRG